MEISWEVKFPGVFWPPAVMISSRKFGSLRCAHHHRICIFYPCGTNQCAQHNTDKLCHSVAHSCFPLKHNLHSHHLNTLNDNLIPPKSNQSFSQSAELSWYSVPSGQRKMHHLSCPWWSVALPSSKEWVEIHLTYCSETELFTSGLSFLAFVICCWRKLSNALPHAELARTEAFGLAISTGDW